MSYWMAMLIGSVVSWIWVAGTIRLAGPLSPRVRDGLLVAGVALPALVPLLRLAGLGLRPDGTAILRVDMWVALIEDGYLGVQVSLGALLTGTTAIFVLQELWPAVTDLRSRRTPDRASDPRLDEAFARVTRAFAAAGISRRFNRLRIRRVDSDRPAAGLHGLFMPRILVTRGLMRRLDDEQLDAVVAHELAHRCMGDNLRTLLIWLLRALQAPSPTALVLFRDLVEAREMACDEIAAQALGRPAALADTLLEVYRVSQGQNNGVGRIERARREVKRTADRNALRHRVRALLGGYPEFRGSKIVLVASVLMLFALLWGIA